MLTKKHEKFLEKWNSYIWTVVNSKIFWMDYREDCVQYVSAELIKLYKNKNKYPGEKDWECVIKTTVGRRTGDFRNKMLREHEHVLATNRLEKNEDCDFDIDNAMLQESDVDSASTSVEGIIDVVFDSGDFTDWEKEYLEVLVDAHNEGADLSDANVAWKMGYDKTDISEFYVNVKGFRKKIKNLGEKLR